MLLHTPLCDFGWKAPDFELPDLDGKLTNLKDIQGPNGTLIAFICNHCPYVIAIIEGLVEDMKHLQEAGVGVAAIMSNDYRAYPKDAPDKMKTFSDAHGFTFPYLLDESQGVARSYNAICTPDFFGFNAELGLQYRGRIDEDPKNSRPGLRRELREAMLGIAEHGKGPEKQTASMGCSIKWREDE